MSNLRWPGGDDDAGLAGMKSAAMPVDAKSGEILQSIRDRCERRGLHLAFFSKAMVDIISMNTRVTESGNNFRFTGTGNSILDPPESVGDILACCLALDAKTQLINLLGKYAKPPVTNPPGFIKNENGTYKYAATIAEIRDVSTPGDPGTSIFLPRQFVKSDIVNYKIVEKCGNDLIIYIIRDGDVIGFANVCFTFFSDDFFQPEKGIFWNFFGVKNPTLGEPQRGDRVTGREILELLEDLFRLLRFNRSCVPREVPIPGYDNVFDSEEIDKLAGCAAGPAALRFWENNSYIQISKEEAKAAGWTDEEIDDLNIFPVEKRLDKIAAVKPAAVAEEETVFSAAETESMIATRSQSKGTPIQPETSSQFPSRIANPSQSRRSSAESSLASNAGGGGSLATPHFLFQPHVVNPISRVGRLAQGAAKATPYYNPLGAGGGGAMRFNPQSRKPEYSMPNAVVDQEIQDQLNNLNNLFGNNQKTSENQASNNPIEQGEKEAIVEDSGVLTYDSNEEDRLSKNQQGMAKQSRYIEPSLSNSMPIAGMAKQSRDIGPSFSNIIPSAAGMANASNTFANSNSISAGIDRQSKPPSSNVQPYYKKFALPFQKEMFKQNLAYADMLDNKPIKKNDDKINDEVVPNPNPNILEHNVNKEIEDYRKAEREKDLSRPRGPDFDDPPNPIRKRLRLGGRKTNRRQTNKKSVTKKRNPRRRRVTRRRQRRNTRQTKKRNK